MPPWHPQISLARMLEGSHGMAGGKLGGPSRGGIPPERLWVQTNKCKELRLGGLWIKEQRQKKNSTRFLFFSPWDCSGQNF